LEGKVCTKCGEQKAFGEFHKKKCSKDGLHSWCKKCRKKYLQTNTEKYVEYRREYYQANKEKILEFHKEYQLENKEKIIEQRKGHYQANKEDVLKRVKKYRQSERGKETIYKSHLKRKSYKHKVKFTSHERKQILDRDNWKCQSCGIKVHDIRKRVEKMTIEERKSKAHIDHIIPISKGGNSEPRNLRILCATCNLSKSDKQDEQLQFKLSMTL
jgi:5-methylcytosine-specific restriction endonuclease McrA